MTEPAISQETAEEKPKRKRMGRKSKYTKERIERLLDAIRAGSSREGACRYAGIGVSTFYRWLEEPDKQELRDAIEREEGALERRLAGVVQTAAADGNWQAAMTLMERKWPERWARRWNSSVELSGVDGKPIAMQSQVSLDVDAVQEIINVLAASGALVPENGGDSDGGAAPEQVHAPSPDA